ncbi:MAG: ferredoxin-thioredoxin reductase catalytic domain-containing protein [Phycisphaerae bacterium]|nr:ferredoxin-thioredoxin reductase catalytic domain-containing protein [Phycisphaerae bacterium]
MSKQPTTDPNAYRAEIAERVRRHADESACRLNPNAKVVEALLDGLVRRKERFGDYYCPCRVVTGNEETDRANVCPCKTHEEEIARAEKCHCGLFVGEKRI